MTPSGIKPATFLSVAQCLNQLRYCMPLYLKVDYRFQLQEVVLEVPPPSPSCVWEGCFVLCCAHINSAGLVIRLCRPQALITMQSALNYAFHGASAVCDV
jgi:hypothetical protein